MYMRKVFFFSEDKTTWLTPFCCLQEIKDLDELISEIGGELGKFAEEEKSQALSEIKELQVFLISDSIGWSHCM